MKTTQVNALINLADDLKIEAHLPKNSKRYAMLLFVADACILLSMGDKEGSTKLIDLVNPKGDRKIEKALMNFLKILLEVV